jgi:hypothetical protein
MRPLDVLSMLRLEDGRRWIDAACDFQLEDAREVLEGEQPYAFLTRARGTSKTTDLAGAALSELLTATEPDRRHWLAADRDQGGLCIDAIAGFAMRTPAIGEKLDIQSRRVIVPSTRASLEILAADAPSAWGLLTRRVFADELANWTDGPAARRLWEAVSSAVAKRDDARLAVLTTASSPDHFAYKVLQAAHRSPLWRVSERPGPSPWMSEARLEEQRTRLPASVFAQLFLNEWVVADGAFLDPAVIDQAFTLEGPTLEAKSGRGAYVAGLDLGSRNDATAFAIGHLRDSVIYLDRLQVWQGSRTNPVDFGEVESFIAAAHERFRFHLRADPWQSLDMLQRLRRRGIRADEFTFSQGSKQRLAATLLSSLNAGRFRLYEAPGLRDELLGLRLEQSKAGLWSFNHQAGGHDDRASALALVAVGLLERPLATVSTESWMERDEPPVTVRGDLRLVGERYVDLPPHRIDPVYAVRDALHSMNRDAGAGRRGRE